MDAYYSNGLEGYLPTLQCECGKRFREANWEEAGIEADLHLEECSGVEEE
jgi:hypothetical protein